METKRICPVCGQEYTDPPAISRRDNDLMICPECGMIEALGAYEDAQRDREIIGAVEALGYRKGEIRVTSIDKGRSEVFLNGERFGIYDFVKHTFVD